MSTQSILFRVGFSDMRVGFSDMLAFLPPLSCGRVCMPAAGVAVLSFASVCLTGARKWLVLAVFLLVLAGGRV
jgi:hypothetical protein